MQVYAFALLVAMSYALTSAAAPGSPPSLETRQVQPGVLRREPPNPSERDFERESAFIEFDLLGARDSYARRNIEAAEARKRLETLRRGGGLGRVAERDVKEEIQEAWVD